MEKKERKAKFKKTVAILCIFVILQSYFSCFAQIAIAVEEALNEEEIIDSSENEEEIISDDSQEEITSEDESSSSEQDFIVSQEPLISPEEPESEEPDSNEENPEEAVVEETTENEQVEETPQENVQEPEDEQVIENYVEPEITVEVTSENTSIYKGYLYANAISDLKYATDYNTIDVVTIAGGKNMSSLTIQDEPDKMLLITNTKIGLINEMYYRKTRISVEEFKSILGDEGSITLYTPEGEVIGYINKETEVVNNEYVFTYPIQLNSVKFEFTNIIADGKISIKNDKSIKESSDFSRNQISLFSSINTITQASIYVGEQVKSSSYEGNINLEETESRMLIDVDTDTLSVETNNEMAINVTLKTDAERYDLFDNPTIDLEFPSVVENVEVTGATLLYKNGLSIDNWEVTTNALGRKVIKLRLTGSQSEYTPGGAQQGTTLVVYTNVEANRLTADTTENLRMTYTNKDTVRKTYSLEGRDSEDIEINFVGRQELVRELSASQDDGRKVTTIDDKTEKLEIPANNENEQIVTLHGTVLNNYEATLQGLVIVGRIPFVGNLDENGYDLGTNFDSKLQTALTSTGSLVDIYYSEDGEATANSDSWTSDITDVSKYKSFKLVAKENTFTKGESISFDYNVVIPAGLGNNAVGYSTYSASYKIDNQTYVDSCKVGMYTEMKEIEVDDIDDENKENVSELTVGTQVSQCGRILKDGDSVYERQVLKYSLIITNTSDKTFSNVKIKANAENANLYTWVFVDLETSSTGKVKRMEEITDGSKEYEEFEIEKLLPGESKTFEYQVVVHENVQEVYGNVIINSDEMQEQKITTLKNPVRDAEVEVRFSRSTTQSTEDKYNTRDGLYRYTLYIKNLVDSDLNNVNLYLNLPKGMTINPKDINYYNKNKWEYSKTKGINTTLLDNNLLIFDIETLSNGETIKMDINAKIDAFDVDTEYLTYRLTALAEIEDNKYYSNEVIEKFYQDKTKLSYTWTADQDKEMLVNGDVVNFELNLNNSGLNDISYLNISSTFPKGLVINSAICNDKSIEIKQSFDYNYQIDCPTYLKKGEKLNLKINATYNEELTLTDQNILEINALISSSQLDNDIKTNTISYKIVPKYTSERTVQKPLEDLEPENQVINNKPNVISNNNNNNNDDSNNQNSNEIIIGNAQGTTEKVYTISGKVWIDNNHDGIRQSEDLGKKDEKVSLYSANLNGGIDTTNKLETITTNENGEYSFEKVPAGSYVVVLEYNSDIYFITKYQVSDAKQDENSDVISKMVSINGENKLVAVSDVITVSDVGATNIDIGLIEKDLFDLSLKKYIVKAVVKNDNGTKTYNFNNSTNSKVEIRSKDYKSSVVDITYKMIVKNEGDISGYVNKIVDYLPEGVEVNLNASSDWYIGTDGGLYYNGLVGNEINPGETRELTLVVRKELSDGESVTIENKAEIAEYTNVYSMKDRDSTELNKLDEDDLGKATLKISISTGKTVQYIITTLIAIIVLALISRFIIKKKDTKKVFK